jgi:hypothetical protein
MTEQEQHHDDYWTADEPIGEVSLWLGRLHALRLKAHISEETYRQAAEHEIIPLRHRQGRRVYVHAKPYLVVPSIVVDVQLYPTVQPSGAAGETIAPAHESRRQEEMGQAQAWFYPAERVIALWECYLLDRYRTAQFRDDLNTATTWKGFERFLRHQFPAARRIVTTHDDPLYDTAQYQDFLRGMGYRPLSRAAFGKRLR